jgi:hypothetical protein
LPYGQAVAQGYNNPSIEYANIVIVFGQNEGVFVYNGTPSLGNPPILSIANSNTDPYGNTITPSLSLAEFPQLFYAGVPALGSLIGAIAAMAGTDNFGNDYIAGAQIGAPGNNQIQLIPNPSVQSGVPTNVNITAAINGIFAGVANLTTTDADEMLGGVLGAAILGTGSTAKMSAILASPFGTQGAALILSAQNDGGTDTAWSMLGTITTPDDETLVFYPIMWIFPYGMVLYSGASGITVITKTSGSGTITGLPATVKAEAWAGGGGGGTAANFGAAAAGGGEYAQEPSLATSGSVTYVVGAGGTGGVLNGNPSTNGSNSTVTGTSVTVTANGGIKGTSTATPGAGGSGSTNTVHHNGGAGGSTVGGKAGGGGGGSSAGPSNAGNNGAEGSSHGGNGGNAVTGGGSGGSGGNNNANGANGGTPGGGGGGSGAGGNGGNGPAGQVRVTYSTGNPAILASIAAAATTDPFGTSILAGTILAGPGDTNQYNSGPLALTISNTTAITATAATSLPWDQGTGGIPVVSGVKYLVRGVLRAKQITAAVADNFSATGPAASASSLVWNFIETGVTQTTVNPAATLMPSGTVGSPTFAATDNYVVYVDGFFTPSANGTFNVNGWESVSGDSWDIVEGSFITLNPLIAVPG